jgi:heterodisulfide reductase subunit B2
MKVSYYPGCSLHGTALEYDESTQAICRILGVELNELPDWNCCGASSAHATNKALARDLMTRNMAIAEKQGKDLVIPCAACYSRFKASEKEGAKASSGPSPRRNIRILHLLEFVMTSGLAEKIKALQRKSLSGLKAVCYYGCLLVRPPEITDAKHHENPEEMDQLLEMLGAEPLSWSYKTDCCGGSLMLSSTDIVQPLTRKILDKAIEAGAEAIVVACPLCQANLDTRQVQMSGPSGEKYEIPVFYFTELIGLCLGYEDPAKWLKKHFIDPRKLLAAKGII